MKLGFAIPIVGSAVSSAAGLSAFCRGLEDLGYDTLWVGDRLVTPVEMDSTYPGKEQPYPPQMTRYLAAFPSLDQTLDFASELIARTSGM